MYDSILFDSMVGFDHGHDLFEIGRVVPYSAIRMIFRCLIVPSQPFSNEWIIGHFSICLLFRWTKARDALEVVSRCRANYSEFLLWLVFLHEINKKNEWIAVLYECSSTTRLTITCGGNICKTGSWNEKREQYHVTSRHVTSRHVTSWFIR